MVVKSDEILELLDDVMDNGGNLPQAVSNRMLLAAIRKNYRVSESNSSDLKDALPRLKSLEEHQEEHCAKIEEGEKKIIGMDKKLAVLIIAMLAMTAIIAWYTGVDLGWLPLL